MKEPMVSSDVKSCVIRLSSLNSTLRASGRICKAHDDCKKTRMGSESFIAVGNWQKP
jgi:hypothetical protein